MNEDFSEIIAAVKKFAVDNLSLSTLSDEELEEQIKTITDNMIGNRYVSIKNRVDIAQQVFSSIRGFGLLDTIMNDDTITEVMINGADNIFIEQAGRVKRLDESFESQRKLEDIIQRIVGKAGREVNQSNPIVDTRLPDGSRVNVVLPPIALCGPTVTIRKFSKTPMTIEKLISYGSITREIADKLKLLVEAKYNIFICGGTGSGKTTFLNALSNYIPKDERVITIEDSAELQIKGVDNLVSLETRNANASGAGAVTIRDLIKSSLRMRPERIVVGEVRGGEALDMLQAMNTGHDGSLSTGHANSTQDILGYEIEADCENKIELFKDAYLKTVSLAKENYDNISKYLVYIKVLEDTSADKLNVNSNVILYNEISNKSSEATENMGEGLKEGHTVTNEAYTHKGLEGVLSNVEYFKSNNIGLTSGCEMNDEKTDFNVISDHDGGFYGTMKSFVDDIKSQKSNINGELSEDNVIKVYQLKQTINNWINNDDNKTYLANIWALKDYFYSCEGNDCKINEYFENIEGFISDINDIANYTNNYANSYKDKVKSLAVEANKQIRLVFDDCTIMISKYEAIEKDLNAVISDIESAEEKGEKWKDKIDKVTDKSSKQTMTSDYESEAQPLKKADVEALRDKVIIVNKEFYQDILDRIKSLKYCGNKLAEKYDSSKVEKADYEKDFKKSKIMPDTVDSNGMAAAINSAKANFESDTGNSFKAFRRLLENDEFSTKSGFTTKAQEENQQFFEYLASNFEYKSGTEEEEKSEASDGGKEALIDKGKVTSAKEKAKNDKTLSGDVSSDFLDAMVTNNSKSQQDIGVDPTDPEGSSDDNVTDTADSMSDEETTSFLKALGDIAATERDKLYLVEYMRNMFSCYTTNIDPDAGNPNVEEKKDKEVGSQYENKDDFEKTLSGIAISADNNYYYGGECEYILWGGTPSSAVNKTKASIFGIRFILNLIYAMSAPDINALTFEWATVIAGWTVFGVPIVQTVLKIALALAESAYDLSQLCLGKSVPLYKSSTTWAMSPQGMIGIAKDAATELIENAAQAAGDKLDKLVTNIFDTIGNTANDKIKDLEGTVNNYIEQTKNSITDQVINATVTPFLNSVKGIVGKIDSNWGEEKIKEELNASLEKLKENSTDDIFGKCKTLAIEYLQGKVDKVTSTIYQNLSSTTENMANETMKQVKGLFYSENSTPGYIEELTEQLKAKVNELSSKLQENVTNALNSTEDNVKEKLNSALTDFTDKVSGTVSSGLDKVGEAAPDNNTVGDVTNAKAATISLNYKEYLYAFMLIGILANEDNMIARTGYLMQMNISQKMTDAGFDDSDRENFDMTKMYTMVQIHSEADVDSVFMGMFEKKTVNGEESYSLNFDGDGSSTDRLVYNGFIGY